VSANEFQHRVGQDVNSLFVWSWSKLVLVRENDASADQQQIQHDRGDAARHSWICC
jgi:hypothetical protein